MLGQTVGFNRTLASLDPLNWGMGVISSLQAIGSKSTSTRLDPLVWGNGFGGAEQTEYMSNDDIF
jgi:hypothetical protein